MENERIQRFMEIRFVIYYFTEMSYSHTDTCTHLSLNYNRKFFLFYFQNFGFLNVDL